MGSDRRPAVGERAPSFSARTHHGETVESARLPGGRPCAVMFYPFAFSRVCGSELSELHSRRTEIERAGAEVLAVSCDAVHSLRAYAEALAGAEELGFRLLSDFWPHGRIARAFGVLDESRGAAERATFFLDAGLSIRHLQRVPAGEARDLDEMLAVLRELGTQGRSGSARSTS